MTRSVVSAALAAIWSTAVLAQSGGTMDKNATMEKMNNMGKMADVTYTGCLEAGNAEGTFRLTHVGAMANDSMKKDAMANDSMKKDAMGKGAMNHEMMASTTVNLTSGSIDLRKSVGRKVSVTGSATPMKDGAGMDASTLTVKTLKNVAGSCS